MGKCCIEITIKMGVCNMDDLVLEKITSGILSSNEFGIEKWIVIIFLAVLPILINILYKRVNSRYYSIDEKYFNFLSLKKLLVYVCVFIFVLLIFAYLFYAFIINFSSLGNIIYFLLLFILCISISFYICKIDINKNCFISLFGIIAFILLPILTKLCEKTFKFLIISFLIISIIVIFIKIIKFLRSLEKRAANKCCINNRAVKFINIVSNSIVIFILSLLSMSLMAGIIFTDKINQNLSNSTKIHFNEDKKRSEDIECYVNKECYIGEEWNTNSGWYINEECYLNRECYINKERNIDENYSDVKNYIDYLLKNSGDLKVNEFIMLFKNPKDYIDYTIDVEKNLLQKNQLPENQLPENLIEFFKSAEEANINKELFATMRLLIILNLLLDPIIFIIAMASIFILAGAQLLLLRNRFFKPNKIKIYEYIDKPGLVKEVVITEYKDKLLVMEGLIYNNNLYLDRTNYRIIDLSDKLKFVQEKFDSVIFDKLDLFIPVIIIDNCGKKSKHSVDISLNLQKETLKINTLDYKAIGIDISCDVIFKNNCMNIKSEIKRILETVYGINNFIFKLDESVKENFSIDEDTGEIRINLDLE